MRDDRVISSRPSTASTVNAVQQDTPARPSANQAGVAPCCTATLVIGQALDSNTTESAIWISPSRGIWRVMTRRSV